MLFAARLFYLSALFVFASTKCPGGPLGAEDGRLRDDQFSASSEKNKWHSPKYARLNAGGDNAWCSKIDDVNPYIKVTLDSYYDITGVAVQGRYHSKYAGWYVKKFEIIYRIDQGGYGTYYVRQKAVDGPTNKTEIVKVPVNFRTKQVMIRPLQWYPKNYVACLRLELYGCQSEYQG